MPQFLNHQDADFEARFAALLGMKREEADDVDASVAAIIADVRTRGDQAVIDLTARFDRLTLMPETLAFTESEIAAEIAKVSPDDRAALNLAADRIRAVGLHPQRAEAETRARPPHHRPDAAGRGIRMPQASHPGSCAGRGHVVPLQHHSQRPDRR